MALSRSVQPMTRAVSKSASEHTFKLQADDTSSILLRLGAAAAIFSAAACTMERAPEASAESQQNEPLSATKQVSDWDAVSFARERNISVDEAAHRLLQQTRVENFSDRMRVELGERFGGVW